MASTKWPPSEFDPLLAEIGRIVFHFNTLERSVRTILWCLASRDGRDQIHHAVTMHLGNIGITDALRTVVTEFYESPIQGAVLHVIEIFDRTREYRNWYIHGFGNIYGDGSGGLHSASAKARLIDSQDKFSFEDAEWLAQWCQTASHHCAAVYGYCAETLQRIPADTPPRALPEKLPLPDRLKKPRKLRLGDQAPPPPSQS